MRSLMNWILVLKLRVSALDAERLVSSYQAIQGRPAKTQANSWNCLKYGQKPNQPKLHLFILMPVLQKKAGQQTYGQSIPKGAAACIVISDFLQFNLISDNFDQKCQISVYFMRGLTSTAPWALNPGWWNPPLLLSVCGYFFSIVQS